MAAVQLLASVLCLAATCSAALDALMLHEQGKLPIDDPLSKYFPKFVSVRRSA